MAESSNPTQIPPQQEQNLQQEQQPESPTPFEPAPQVGFNIKDIIFNPNNEVALLYPTHTNSKYFTVVSDFISKCCLREAFTRTPNQYKEYMSEFWGKTMGFDQITNKDVIILYCLANGIDIDYARLIWEDIINKLNKKTREKVVPYSRFLSLLLEHKMERYGNDNITLNPTQAFSVHNWALKKNQAEGPSFIEHMLDICKADKPVEFKAPKTSSKAEKNGTQGTKPGAKSGQRKKQIPFLYNHPQSKIETSKGVSSLKEDTGSQIDHSLKQSQFSLAKDVNLSQPPASKPVVAGMHKEVQQATSSPTSLRVTTSTIIYSESASEHDVLVSSKAGADSGLSAPKDLISKTTGNDEVPNKLSLDHIFAGKGASNIAQKIKEEINTSPDLSSSNDTQKNIKLEDLSEMTQNSKLKNEKTKDEDEVALLSAQPSYPNVAQLIELLAKIKTLDALPSFLNKVTKALNKFAQVIESASKKARDHSVPSAGLAGSHLAEREKNTQKIIISYSPRSSPQPEGVLIKKDKGKKAMSSKDPKKEGAESNSDDDTISLASSMVESSKKKKIKKFDFVTEGCEHVYLTKETIKEHKRIKESVKADAVKQEVEVRKEEWIDLLGIYVVTKKGPITLKVYGEDGTSEVIPNFKASDLHLAKVGINLAKPLSEQDPLDKLNDLAKMKRKNADDIHDYFRANKRLKSSVQYEDHPAGTVLNEPALGMILFNSFHRQDFVTIEDFRDFPNKMLYAV
ncbi:hypothetical protein Tco_0880876 [Tanacetum coccineum]